ncbi:hypothetical protein NECAME_08449 [Necator americanus]|uniref:Uncharacterized protein n=1 Tax=Necator americanus TaxID=51031 RepID=W2TI86_NECAM|nr:hypothetical protein NECAME_08449 [Necator americanus]ETN81538.1 hypothetical protein NECAME_08449 [Necator americanus]
MSRSFVLNEEVFKTGLCEENVQDAIVAEIYCLCGMTPIVELVYSIKTTPIYRETWRVLVSLLERDYGEALLDTARKRPAETTERKDEPPSKVRPVKNSKAKMTPQSSMGSPPIQEEDPQTPVVVQPVLSESSVVLEEYDNFAEQYNALRAKKTNNRRSSSRAAASSSSQKQITSFIAPKAATTALRVETTGATADIMLGNQVSQYKARCAVERAKNQSRGDSVEKAATDFSELCPTSFAHDFLSSLRTPEKTPAKSKQEEDRSEIMNRLFGGELSMSPTRASEHTFSSYRPHTEDTSSRCDLMERALSEASLTPSKMKAYAVSQHGSGTLPDDVRSSMVEMMNQDSRDYVKQFEQLANTIAAPRNRGRGERTPDRRKRKR